MRVAVLLSLLAFVPTALAQDAAPPIQTVVFTSSVSGYFGEPRCTADRSLDPSTFAPHASAISHAAERADTFVFDTGGLFEPHGVGRFALNEDPATLARLARSLGYDALAFAGKDLQGPREQLILLGHRLQELELPFVATNLRCDENSAALCSVLDDASDPIRIVQSGGERIALLSFIDPAILPHVDEANRLGISLEPLDEAFHRAIVEARAGGATLVIATVDNASGSQASGDAIALAESLPPPDRPDLLVSARAGRQLLYARPAGFQPPIAAAPPGRAATVEVRRRTDAVHLEMLVQPLAPSMDPAPGLEAFVADIGPRYCAALGGPMAGAHLGSRIDPAGLADLTGGAMRVAADAEIAILNLPMIDERFGHPSGHTLTASDIQLGIQFDDPMMVATVDAGWLRDVARAIAARSDIRATGLAITNANAADEAITVNGRPLASDGRYRVVVARFLATGGSGALPAGPHFSPLGTLTVREALLDWLRIERSVDPRTALPDPATLPEWSFRFASDTSVGSTTIMNPGGYADTQFSRAGNLSYGTQNQLDLVARSTRISWENQALLRYRSTATRGQPREESDDLASFRSTFAYREPRTRHPVAYVPEPYGEAYLETEFTVPSSRTARHFLVRPTLGARFTLAAPLTLKLQAGGSFELFDRNVEPSPGVGAVLTLTSFKLFEAGRRSGTLEGLFDWFFSGLGISPVHTVRGNLGLALQLNHVLGLSFTSTLFAVKHPDAAMSYALNATANLRLAWYVRTQR